MTQGSQSGHGPAFLFTGEVPATDVPEPDPVLNEDDDVPHVCIVLQRWRGWGSRLPGCDVRARADAAVRLAMATGHRPRHIPTSIVTSCCLRATSILVGADNGSEPSCSGADKHARAGCRGYASEDLFRVADTRVSMTDVEELLRQRLA